LEEEEPLADGVVVVRVEELLVDLEDEEAVVLLLVEFDEDPHSVCCRALAVATSAVVQFATRQLATAVW